MLTLASTSFRHCHLDDATADLEAKLQHHVSEDPGSSNRQGGKCSLTIARFFPDNSIEPGFSP